MINDFSLNPPDRQGAFAVALKIENSAGEQHFQRVTGKPSDSNVVKIFQELCEDDLNHLLRIKQYMKEVGEIEIAAEYHKKKILIVIDEDSVAKLLETILAEEGDIDYAQNGREGLQKISESNYDLVISGFEMPDIDGLAFFKQAKEISPDLSKRFLFLPEHLLRTD